MELNCTSPSSSLGTFPSHCNETGLLDVEEAPSDTTDLLSYILCGPLMATLIVFGLVGNALCWLVLSRPERLPRVNMYLLTLACWDFGMLLASFYLYSLPVLTGGRLMAYEGYVHGTPYAYAILNATHSGSIWITVLMGVERYFAVCHPLKHRAWNITVKRTIIALLTLGAFAVFYSVPRLFETRVIRNVESGQAELEYTQLGKNLIYRMSYRMLGGVLLFSVGPVVTLIVLSVYVTSAIQMGVRMRRNMTAHRGSPTVMYDQLASRGGAQRDHYQASNHQDQQEHSVTVMLIVVILKFLCCHSLPAVVDLCESTMGEEFQQSAVIIVLIDLSHLLGVFNSSCNAGVYYACSARFREDFTRSVSCGACYRTPDYYNSQRRTRVNPKRCPDARL